MSTEELIALLDRDNSPELKDAAAVYMITHGMTPPELSSITGHDVAELSWLMGSATFESVRAAEQVVTSALSDLEPRAASA